VANTRLSVALLFLLLASCGQLASSQTAVNEPADASAARPFAADPAAAGRPAATPIVARGASFTCTPVRVWDGDGPIWCAEGPRVRLSGIAAREIDGGCNEGHPCPEASAEAAKLALTTLLGGAQGRSSEGHDLVNGPTLACRSDGGAGGSRTAAWCSLPNGRDLSCAMIATRTVVRWPRYDPQARLNDCR